MDDLTMAEWNALGAQLCRGEWVHLSRPGHWRWVQSMLDAAAPMHDRRPFAPCTDGRGRVRLDDDGMLWIRWGEHGRERIEGWRTAQLLIEPVELRFRI
jgi:hypothetical protein